MKSLVSKTSANNMEITGDIEHLRDMILDIYDKVGALDELILGLNAYINLQDDKIRELEEQIGC